MRQGNNFHTLHGSSQQQQQQQQQQSSEEGTSLTSSSSTSPSPFAQTINPYVQNFTHAAAPSSSSSSLLFSSAALQRRTTPSFTAVNEKEKNNNSDYHYHNNNNKNNNNIISTSSTGVKDDASDIEMKRMCELQRLLRLERYMRLAAERRMMEESEKGTRAAIIIEANYGARLLHSIFLEAIESLSTTTTNNDNNNNNNTWDRVRDTTDVHNRVSPRRRPPQLLAPARDVDETTTSVETTTPTASYENLLEENTALREELERCKSIETADRLEMNELYRNMRTLIEQLTRERNALQAELTYWKTQRVDLARNIDSGGRIIPLQSPLQSSLQQQPWHYVHLVEATPSNTEELPESAYRRRVLPIS